MVKTFLLSTLFGMGVNLGEIIRRQTKSINHFWVNIFMISDNTILKSKIEKPKSFKLRIVAEKQGKIGSRRK